MMNNFEDTMNKRSLAPDTIIQKSKAKPVIDIGSIAVKIEEGNDS